MPSRVMTRLASLKGLTAKTELPQSHIAFVPAPMAFFTA